MGILLTTRYCEHCGRRMRLAFRGTHECAHCLLQREGEETYWLYYHEPLRDRAGRLIRVRRQGGQGVSLQREEVQR